MMLYILLEYLFYESRVRPVPEFFPRLKLVSYTRRVDYAVVL